MGEQPPRVALLASTYRSARFLPAWLASVEAQTAWPTAELIVVANDPEAEECRMLGGFAARHGERVRVIEVEREPLYRSWNRAIAQARAPLLAIANVDDLRTRDGLERQLAALDADAGALFAYGGFSIVTEFPPGAPHEQIDAEPFDREQFTRGMHIGPFFIWRRTGDPATTFFDEQLRVAGDMDLAVRLALHARGVAVGGSLGAYYDGGTGLSTSGRTQQVEKLVLELRYGVYDKIDLRHLPEAARYAIGRVRFPHGWVDVADVVPGYDALLARRRGLYRAPRTLRVQLRLVRR